MYENTLTLEREDECGGAVWDELQGKKAVDQERSDGDEDGGERLRRCGTRGELNDLRRK